MADPSVSRPTLSSYAERDLASGKISRYATGGMADYTGLAWLDGSPSRPERILSPYQTELFENLVQSLQQIKVSVPKITVPSYEPLRNSGFTFGDINIQVDSLNDDADLEKLSEAVMEHIVDAITDGAAVGGLRFT